ncbi:related to mixed-linked glucanase precursor MLG1 [Serendipita indica DSM 11827]|uniref:Related to mixed-linked glucanase MLG1 n=1 Tax=Serendipita indica (strain DSM 11827) TaxID=1109443 RepID=G4TML7_SERID|nr:related to mixed-linked glucanase precursor MLG1 [Serendipita indica DSM 11827]
MALRLMIFHVLATLWIASTVAAYDWKAIVPRNTGRARLHKRAVNKTVWVSAHSYEGPTFFDGWEFWAYPDPTNGLVQYVNRDVAFAEGLAYITPEGRANMHVDSKTVLTLEEVTSRRKLRKSVRLHSKILYTHGLFLLDVAQAPYGCGTWPAYWMTGFNWPADGETDIIENVHSNASNQVAWHTSPGCYLTSPGNYTGYAGSLNCDASINYNKGCGIVDQSIASFGQTFNEKGGGIYAVKWDSDSIDVWFFYRSAIPSNILEGLPDPATWPLPSASLSRPGCDIDKYFKNNMIIFDTTLCGDWAGTSYAAAGCPGTCEERVTNPNSFVNATWSINYIKVYNKTIINTWYLEAGARLRAHAGLFLVLVTTSLVIFGVCLC